MDGIIISSPEGKSIFHSLDEINVIFTAKIKNEYSDK